MNVSNQDIIVKVLGLGQQDNKDNVEYVMKDLYSQIVCVNGSKVFA